MRKRHHLPLLRNLEPDEYLFDTSAWLNIDTRSKKQDVWATIISLIKQGRLFTCAQVLEELHGDEVYLSRLKEFKEALQVGDRSDPQFLMEVGRITHDYPSMSKPTGARTPADQYVVALARLEGYVVVADESIVRPRRKIPGVCKELGIKCLTLDQFIAAELIH